MRKCYIFGDYIHCNYWIMYTKMYVFIKFQEKNQLYFYHIAPLAAINCRDVI